MKNIDDILIEVRKAYRLLYVFNERIFDLMKYIESAFEMEFGGGRSMFTADTPNSWKGKFENWTWDYFNLYFYEFYFKSNNAWLSILLQSDTGLWDIIEDIKNEDELNKKVNKVELYNSFEESKTRLIFITGNGEWNVAKIQMLYDKSINKSLINEGVIEKKNKGKIIYKIFEINNFIDEKTTIQSLKEYVNFLKNNNFDKILYKKE